MTRPVLWRTEGGVTRLELNRPEALNALDPGLARAFGAAVVKIAKEPSRVVILSGRGPAFCAGGDTGFISANTRLPTPRLPALMRSFYASFLALRRLPQVTLASVHGAAVGAGLCLALSCDLRAVTRTARLALNFVRLGLSPGMAAWPLARAALGDARAREFLMTGRFFTGAQLHAWGAASALAADQRRLEEASAELAREIASLSGPALRALKAETALSEPLGPYLALEAREQAACFKRPDIREGLTALRERRAPRFGP